MSTGASNNSLSFILPSTQTPLFTAEWITCAYPASDLYASIPRYLYYALLLLVFLTQWHSWLANVFLGVVATYAGTAAIEAFILISHQPIIDEPSLVSIPYIDPTGVRGNSTLSAIPNLLTNVSTIQVQPAALEYDIDALLAITVTGYLMMLPMHCWSTAVRANRARHLLIFIWNILMFAGMICSIVIWPSLYDSPLQFRFCYPTLLDSNSTTSDGHYDNTLWRGDWNTTIWNIFQDFSIAANLNDNCLYPCFNTSQVLRRHNSLVGNVPTKKDPRLSTALWWAGVNVPEGDLDKEANLASLMYAALIVTTVVMLVLLLLLLGPAKKFTRVPIHRPKDLVGSARSEVTHMIWNESKQGVLTVFSAFKSPISTVHRLRALQASAIRVKSWHCLRFICDMLALITLFFAMIITPATIVVFVIWIEWYIHRDLVSSEAPEQVGQWGTLVSVALILVSAFVLRLRYLMASKNEVEKEISHVQEHLGRLELLLEEKKRKEDEQLPNVNFELSTV